MEKIKNFTTGLLLVGWVCISYASPQGSTIANVHSECYELMRSEQFQKMKDKAEDLLESDVEMTQELKTEMLYFIGYANAKLNLFSESISLYAKAIENSENSEKKGKIYNNMASVLHYMNLHHEAIRECDKSIALSELWSPVSYYNKALSQIALSDYAGAIVSLETGLKVCMKINLEVYPAKMWNRLGIVEKELFDISKNAKHKRNALQYFEYALDLKNHLKNPIDQYRKSQIKLLHTEEGRAHHYIGNLKLTHSNTIGAIRKFKESIAVQQHDQYRFYAIQDLANLYKRIGENEHAKFWCDSALAIFPSITLSGEALMIFFSAQDLGYTIPQEPFQTYFDEKEKTERTYVAYIGRQVMREKQQMIRGRNQRTLIISLGIILVLVTTIAIRAFRRIRSARLFLEEESQRPL